jgi:hypothetical protein
MGDLTQHFSKSEFACKCGCGADHISPDLVDILEQSRQATGIPYEISSGVRCEKHNKEIGGVNGSAHVAGLAADIKCVDGVTRYRMIFDFIKRFKRIEICSSWIHVDIDLSRPHPTIFLGS